MHCLIKGPIAIRYPRGTGKENILNVLTLMENVDIEFGKGLIAKEGKDITIIGLEYVQCC